jgi:hypothetical protein
MVLSADSLGWLDLDEFPPGIIQSNVYKAFMPTVNFRFNQFMYNWFDLAGLPNLRTVTIGHDEETYLHAETSYPFDVYSFVLNILQLPDGPQTADMSAALVAFKSRHATLAEYLKEKDPAAGKIKWTLKSKTRIKVVASATIVQPFGSWDRDILFSQNYDLVCIVAMMEVTLN